MMAREPAVVRLVAREQGPLQRRQPGGHLGQAFAIACAVGPHRHHHGGQRQSVQSSQHLGQQGRLGRQGRRGDGPVRLVAPVQQHQAGGGIAVMTGQGQPLPHCPLIELPLGGAVDAEPHRIRVAAPQEATLPRGQTQPVVAVGQAARQWLKAPLVPGGRQAGQQAQLRQIPLLPGRLTSQRWRSSPACGSLSDRPTAVRHSPDPSGSWSSGSRRPSPCHCP